MTYGMRQAAMAWVRRMPRRLRKGLAAAALLAAGGLCIGTTLAPVAHAAGSASFSLSPADGSYNTDTTFTVSVYVNGSNYNEATANVSYNSAYVQCQSIAIGSSFSTFNQVTCTKSTSGSTVTANIEGGSSSALNGSQLLGTMTFKTLTTATASTPVSVTAGSGASASEISDATDSHDIWDGSTPSASFTITAPTPPPSGSGNTGGTTNTIGSGSASGTSGGAPKAPTISGTTTPTTPTLTTTRPTATAPPVTATPTSLTLTVTDKDGKPVKGAKVVLDSKYSSYTDTQGKTGFSDLSSGTHSVVVSGSGKTTLRTRVTLTGNQANHVSLKLGKAISPVTIGMSVVLGLAILAGAGFGYIRLSGRVRPSRTPMSTNGIVTGSGTASGGEPTVAATPQATVVQPSTGPGQSSAPTGDTTPTSGTIDKGEDKL